LIKKIIDDNTYNSSEIAGIVLEKQKLLDELEEQVQSQIRKTSEINHKL
jgi:hypothetical protein